MTQELNVWLDKILGDIENVKIERKRSNRLRVDVDARALPAVLELLQGRASYVHLSAISCVDRIDDDEFELVYHVWSYEARSLVSAHTRIPRDPGVYLSIYDLYVPAAFFERDIHEMFGVYFEGSPDMGKFILTEWDGPPPMRKEFDSEKFVNETFNWEQYHPQWLKDLEQEGGGVITPAEDARNEAENYEARKHPPSNEFELNFGPNHPGIEGNYAFRVKLNGDEVLEAKADAGYLHRGFEKLMEGRLWIQNIALVPRICVPDPVPMEVCYSLAVEEISGLEVPERAQWIRVMQLEMSRLAAHLFAFGGHAATCGMYTPSFWGVADRDFILDRFEELTGGRVYSIYNIPGGVRRDVPTGFLERLGSLLDYLESRLPDYDNLFFTNQVFIRRARDVGVMSQEQALKWGVTGPNLRATGLAFDVRRDDPYLVYDQIDFDIPTEPGGDCLSRNLVRRSELLQSIRILRQVIERLPSIKGPIRCPIPNPLAWNVPVGESYPRVESSKGELAYYVVSNGGDKPYRVHVRGPSSMHAVQVLEKLAVGSRLEDIAQIMFSLDACPPEVDR